MESLQPLPTRERAPVDPAFSPIAERSDAPQADNVIPIDRPTLTSSGLPKRRAGSTDMESFSLSPDTSSSSPVAPVIPIERNADKPDVDLEGLAKRRRALSLLHDLHRQADAVAAEDVHPVDELPVESHDTSRETAVQPEGPAAPAYDKGPRHRGTGRLTRFALRLFGREKAAGGKHKLVPGKHRAE